MTNFETFEANISKTTEPISKAVPYVDGFFHLVSKKHKFVGGWAESGGVFGSKTDFRPKIFAFKEEKVLSKPNFSSISVSHLVEETF